MKRTKWKGKLINDSSEQRKIKIPEIPKAIYSLLSPYALKLYMFYRYMVKHQNTDQIYATDSFCMNKKGLGWSRTLFYKAKNELYRFGLIQTIQTRKENSQDFDKRYIKVFFIVDENVLKAAELQRRTTGEYNASKNNGRNNSDNSEITHKRQGSTAELQRRTCFAQYAKVTPNALIIKHKIYTAFEKVFSKASLEKDHKLKSTILKYIQYRQDKKLSVDLPLMEFYAKMLHDMHPSREAIASINNAIEKGWSGIKQVNNKPTKKHMKRPNDVCPFRGTFGRSFQYGRSGCHECEENHPSLWQRCKIAHNDYTKDNTISVKNEIDLEV
jgi:hypothetical protein